MTTAIARTPIDAYAVSFDFTEYYNIDPADRPYIESIRAAFVFDRNQRTHLCELTASYFLIHLYDYVCLSAAAEQLDDDAREELRERLDETYAHCGCDDEYRHCSGIERLIAANQPGNLYHYGDVEERRLADSDDADENHAAGMETIREHLCGNCPF